MQKTLQQHDFEKNFFRKAMAHFATGVTIVTTMYEGEVRGLTVNAFCSVSLDPLLLLVCINNTSTTLPLIRQSRLFAVNILLEEQAYLSRGFAAAEKDHSDYLYHTSYHTAVTGAPIFDGVPAFFDARVVNEYPAGDHSIFIGQVAAMGTSEHVVLIDDTEDSLKPLLETRSMKLADDQSPLIYYRGRYRHLAEER